MLAIATAGVVTRRQLGCWGYSTLAACHFCDGVDTIRYRLLECPAPEAVRRREGLSGAMRERLEEVGNADPLCQRAWACAALGPHPFHGLAVAGLEPPRHRRF